MILSKSFGYALRGILYVAMMNSSKEKVPLDEMAEKLAVPRYFLAKVMKKLVKEGILDSVRGPYGGFCINESTLKTKIIELVELSGDAIGADSCVLRLRKCNAKNPCPLHTQVELIRNKWFELFNTTTIADLLKKDQPDFIKSIAVI
jgi:Rrf2 family iron-sulfur cluster assembly transcriptional regulator